MGDHYGRHEIEAERRFPKKRLAPLAQATEGLRGALNQKISMRIAEPIVSQVARHTAVAEKRRKARVVKINWFQLGLERRWRGWTKLPRSDSMQFKWEVDPISTRRFRLRLNGWTIALDKNPLHLQYTACRIAEILRHRPGQSGIWS